MKYTVRGEFKAANQLPLETEVAEYAAARQIILHWAGLFNGFLSALYYIQPDGQRVYHPSTPAPPADPPAIPPKPKRRKSG